MQIGRTFLGLTGGLMLSAGLSAMLSGCQTLSQQQGAAIPEPEFVKTLPGYESAGMVNAADFLGEELMSSNLHRVAAEAWNDGAANTYRIETPQHIYFVQGTEQAKVRIHEIKATDVLRHTSTAGMAGMAVVERTVNLVETPFRAASGIAGRFAKAHNPGEALMVVPSSAAEITGDLANGVKELGVTGWRITRGAAGTQCQGIDGCLAKAGEDVWSGMNSLVGKHAAAREIHDAMGTDPYTDNRVLKRHIDRLSYSDAYVSTSVKIGYTWSGVRILDPLATGVGYYNNGEFVAAYEDAHKARNREKDLIRSWGVDEDTISQLYRSDAFTHRTRSKLSEAIAALGDDSYKARMIVEAANSSTRFIAESRLRVLQYLAGLHEAGQIRAVVDDLPSAVAVTRDSTLILPFAVDYLKWTPEIAPAVKAFANLKRKPDFTGAQIHIIGQVSPEFMSHAQKLGVRVKLIE